MSNSKTPGNRKYYVYEWYIVGTGEVFYVGKGCRERWKTRKRENVYFMKMLETHECAVRKIAEGLTEQEAFELEIASIKYYREQTTYRLTNVQDGGEQPPVFRGDESPTKRPEVREKISRALSDLYQDEPERRAAVSERMKKFYSTDSGKETASKRSTSVMSQKEVRDKIKKSNLEYWDSEEKRARKSEIMVAAYASEAVREKVTGKNNGASRQVAQYNLDGKLLNTFDTLLEAEKATGISFKSISKVLRGCRKTAGKFVWKYADKKQIIFSKRRPYEGKTTRNRKRIAQYTINDELLAVYESITEAVKNNNFHTHTNIAANLSGRTKSAYGFVWKYQD